jgi:hypothetical protein
LSDENLAVRCGGLVCPHVRYRRQRIQIVQTIKVNARVVQEPAKQAAEIERTSWPTFLNSPFVVTLLGGIIVTMASQLWQEHAAQLNFERLSWTEAMKERRTAAREFANHIDGALYTLQVFKRREFWLRAHIHEPPNFTFPDGRDFKEERTFYESTAQRLYGGASPVGLIALIQATFTSTDVQHQATALQAAFNDFATASDEAVLSRQLTVLNAADDALLRAINGEIKALGLHFVAD